MSRFYYFLSLLLVHTMSYSTEYHVYSKGDDTNVGNLKHPFKTISKAAQVAYSGDIITVHSGVYREWINPPRGGKNDSERIIYRAAFGENVHVKGSEHIGQWSQEDNGLWKVVIPNSFFGKYNPYIDLVHGDWFEDHEKKHHTGDVFLNDQSLYEVFSLKALAHPASTLENKKNIKHVWYCENDNLNTTIWANFQGYNPNKELVEISVRNTCFYPEKQQVNFITISGFHFSQAATQWAAPTAEQIGMVATHWNKGWIIENNVMKHSKCVGITLGKERKTGHNLWLKEPEKDGTVHYIEVIFKALKNEWNKETIGSHTIRGNTISDCEQAGICGSLGGAFSEIYDNHIFNINTKGQFGGWEIGGIKLHGAIDTRIEHNRIHDCVRGMWLDWMTQGARVTRNLLYRNTWDDILLEVNHGPHLIDNNIFMSSTNIVDWSQGGAYVHNLFVGSIINKNEGCRFTPYHVPHSTEITGLAPISLDDERFYNNFFINKGLAEYDSTTIVANGNVYYHKAIAPKGIISIYQDVNFDPQVGLTEKGNMVFLKICLQNGFRNIENQIINTKLLGVTKFSKCIFDNPDGTLLEIDKDYLGNIRSSNSPTSGAFERLEEGENYIRIW